jgi:hypothetical protein
LPLTVFDEGTFDFVGYVFRDGDDLNVCVAAFTAEDADFEGDEGAGVGLIE